MCPLKFDNLRVLITKRSYNTSCHNVKNGFCIVCNYLFYITKGNNFKIENALYCFWKRNFFQDLNIIYNIYMIEPENSARWYHTNHIIPGFLRILSWHPLGLDVCYNSRISSTCSKTPNDKKPKVTKCLKPYRNYTKYST